MEQSKVENVRVGQSSAADSGPDQSNLVKDSLGDSVCSKAVVALQVLP